jgi:hypothetical protein
MLVEWVWFNKQWGFLGNPFKTFVDLFAMVNTSVIMLVSHSYGYYLHGRSVHVNTDVK